jgi:hypothetical protein
MTSWIYYKDVEKELVEFFVDKLGTSVNVSTKKLPADDPDAVANQLVLTVSPSGDKTPVTRFYGVVLEIYAEDYSEASNLSRSVEMYLRQAPEFTDSIKRVDIVSGPIRLAEEGLQEKRSLSADLVVKAFTD